MAWATFNVEDKIHVVPCTELGLVDPSHDLDMFCICNPYKDINNKNIIIHEEIN